MTNFFDLLSWPMQLCWDTWSDVFSGLPISGREETFFFFMLVYSMAGALTVNFWIESQDVDKPITNKAILWLVLVLTIPIYPVALLALDGMIVTGISHAMIEGIKEYGKKITDEWKQTQ